MPHRNAKTLHLRVCHQFFEFSENPD